MDDKERKVDLIDWSSVSEENNQMMADMMREKGRPWAAKYIEKFGMPLNPWFNYLTSRDYEERFYKKCVESSKPWNEFMEEPDWNNIIL